MIRRLPLSAAERKRLHDIVLARDRYRCRVCLKGRDKAILQACHIIPRSKGGPDTPENMVTKCYGCHCEDHPWMLKGGWKDGKRLDRVIARRELRKIIKRGCMALALSKG